MNASNTFEITQIAQEAAAAVLGCNVSDLTITNVSGGYSLNRRSLVSYDGRWIFVKEVDKELLKGDGAEEMKWLQKDHGMTEILRRQAPEIVSEWSGLFADNHVLLMSSYRQEDGWLWVLPSDDEHQRQYIQAVIDATKQLEQVKFDSADSERLALHPFFRDELALDNGLTLILENEALRNQLIQKYESMTENETSDWLHTAYQAMRSLLHDTNELQQLSRHAKELINQPERTFNHCDVRSDNIAYNPTKQSIKFFDWNWASFAPSKFGSTEFLIDMARRGVDVTPWIDELNPELLAATVGYYAKRCLKDPLSPESTLRDMQAQSAAIALCLYRATRSTDSELAI